MIIIKQYGGFIRRAIASIVDGIIFAFIPGYFGTDNQTASLLVIVLDIAYNVWMVGTYGATIGKMVMALRVTKVNGSKISYSDALLREIAKVLSFAIFGLGFFWVIWDKKKQGWHDKLAKTVVVKLTK